MSASLRALLTGIIDYAGLFPPAKLPLDQAIRNYAHYRQELDAWMLGRFICPATRLQELTPFVAELFSAGPSLSISVLGRGGSNGDEFLANLPADLQAIAAFRDRHDGRVTVDVFEVRLPADIVAPQQQEIRNTLLADALRMIETAGPLMLTPYHEIGLGPEWQMTVPAVIASLRLVNGFSASRTRGSHRPAGFKLRCGGLEASAFPTPEQVALTLAACRDHAVSLKATAGLHHPIRHFDHGVQTKMHGFLNVFCAGVLAHARRLQQEQVRQIIEDEDAGHFVFEDEGFRWKDLRATTAEIVAARQQAVIAFGSCSFDEPRDDLRDLGLLR